MISIYYVYISYMATKYTKPLYDIGLTAIVMLLLDIVFLYANSDMFVNQVIAVQRTNLQIKYWGAAACYVFLVLGLYYFIIREGRPVWDAFVLGLVIYGVYELTNYSIIKKWRVQTVIQDTLWGGVLFAATTWVVYNVR